MWYIFPQVDGLGFSATTRLFACVSPTGSVFDRRLDQYFQGARDGRTLERLGIAPKVG